jgi:hypothetical protein
VWHSPLMKHFIMISTGIRVTRRAPTSDVERKRL